MSARALSSAERQRLCRARQRVAATVIRAAISEPVLNDLIDGDWVAENESRDPRVVGDAVGRLLDELQHKGALKKIPSRRDIG